MSIWNQLEPLAQQIAAERQCNVRVSEIMEQTYAMQQATNNVQNLMGTYTQPSLQTYTTQPTDQRAIAMLYNRLRGLNGSFVECKTDFLWAHIGANDLVYVFYLHEDRSGVLTDSIHIYPSDKLITQIRLLWS